MSFVPFLTSASESPVCTEIKQAFAPWRQLVLLLTLCTLSPVTVHAAPDLDTLKTNLSHEFDDNFVGYAFAIARNGAIRRAGAGGWARIPGDGRKPMGTYTRQNVASVSKTISAIAVLQLLEANAMNINDPVAPFLPEDWPRGPGFRVGEIDGITFGHLLAHTSGLNQRFLQLERKGQHEPWGNDWDGLRFVVRKGVNKSLIGDYSYKNANYALMRILVPKLWESALNTSWIINADNAGPLFMWYVGEHIFRPAGVTGASCKEPAGALHGAGYDVTNPQGPGALWNLDDVDCGGHAGWHLSARNLAKISLHANCANYPYLSEDERLLSPASCFIRDYFRLGWDDGSNGTSDRHHDVYWHGGTLFTSKEQPHKALRSCVVKIPDGIDISAVVTSSSWDGQTPCSKILDAVEQSMD